LLGDQGSLAFVITGDSFTTVELPDATPANLASAVDNTLGWSNREQPYPKPLRDLYTWLVAPLAAHLQTPQVVIVPHQRLQYVPFAALHDGQTYFGQQHLPGDPSASALLPSSRMPPGQARVRCTPLVRQPATGDRLPALDARAAEPRRSLPCWHTAVTDARPARPACATRGPQPGPPPGRPRRLANVANPLQRHLPARTAKTRRRWQAETHEIYGLRGNQLVVLSACQSNVGELGRGRAAG
jgi:CHAT domain-containing protein